MREAGALAARTFQTSLKNWTKSGGSPVSEADIAVDNFLRERLTSLAPDCGWLSEETEDDLARLRCAAHVDRRSDRRHARLPLRPHRLVDLGRAGGERPSRDRGHLRADGGRALPCGGWRGHHTQRERPLRQPRARSFDGHPGRGPKADAANGSRKSRRISSRSRKYSRSRCASRASRRARSTLPLRRTTATTGTLRLPIFWCTKPAAR